MPNRRFTHHLDEVGETYTEHMGTAAGFGLQMVTGGLACLVHAVFPFLFVNTASRTMDALHRRMNKRSTKMDWERHPII
jgi:hypothetical protein